MTTIEERPTFLTIRETAELLRVHRRTAYRYLAEGRLPARKFGGVWLVDAAELERRLDEESGDAA